jgi:hypothetical protein
MQTVGGRVKTAVKRDGRGNLFFQFRRVGAISHEPAPFEFFQNAHANRLIRHPPIANRQLARILLVFLPVLVLVF